LALAFGLENEEYRSRMASRLLALIREKGNHLATGFPAAPYLLFALCDNDCINEAYQLLTEDTEPSWLYQVKHGATTVWEHWAAVREDGTIGGSSLNHYAYGSVGAFFYQRVCGLESMERGYSRFRVKPYPGGTLTWAECEHRCPYGLITVRWEREESDFLLRVTVPEGTCCEVTLPDGTEATADEGSHEYLCAFPGDNGTGVRSNERPAE
jgi:alpha-L-rhamnosidase